jgi:hypothetical protein
MKNLYAKSVLGTIAYPHADFLIVEERGAPSNVKRWVAQSYSPPQRSLLRIATDEEIETYGLISSVEKIIEKAQQIVERLEKLEETQRNIALWKIKETELFLAKKE